MPIGPNILTFSPVTIERYRNTVCSASVVKVIRLRYREDFEQLSEF